MQNDVYQLERKINYMKPYEVKMIADSAFRHGQAYAQNKILRSSNKYMFKNPQFALPEYVVRMNMDDHIFLEKVYKHAFRAGLRSV